MDRAALYARVSSEEQVEVIVLMLKGEPLKLCVSLRDGNLLKSM